ncbi:Long-chain-fatty-acid--CoA ligase [Saccharothrix obliqua]|uniref:Long-chain-fatty-acid--CoA ligase n=1 Tax=Saccharothrix obliqua TaxID=2861747 RepID=UPI001C5D4704|nr:Long-chain-fatty-acid--CoA ligase [Saccharothrix obliqua]MBW4719974.1 Long-chain-fatty-acid--CoA ligase [Saccharothrix obliqua]
MIVNLAERPDLLEAAVRLGSVGAEFMGHDPVASLTRARRLADRWPECFLVVLDGDVPVARAVAVPLVFPDAERTELPDHGWDGAILWAAADALDGRAPTCLVALDVQVAEGRRGEGIAAVALGGLRDVARARGLRRFVVPVRPTTKDPLVGMEEFLRRRSGGFSEDPWIRAHERLGARVVKIAPFSMTITGTVAQWAAWTGMTLVDGPNVVDGGLTPVVVSGGVGVYVEPNVWMEHTLVPDE